MSYREKVSSKKVRGIVEEGCQKKELILGVVSKNSLVDTGSDGIVSDMEVSEGKGLIKGRKIRKLKCKAKKGKDWNEEASLVNVNVTFG